MKSDFPVRLVFHYYLTEDSLQSIITKLHFTCLKHYSNIFTDIIFVVSMDDTTNNNLLSRLEIEVCKIGFLGNLQFKIIENNPIRREVDTFKTEIFDKLNELEGITLFSHCKGLSNQLTEDLFYWIVSMYYFNLQYIDNVKMYLLEYNARMFYGPSPVKLEGDPGEQAWNNKYSWVFPGTIYWMNTKRIHKYMKENNIEYLTDNRWAAENFPGDICPLEIKYYAHPSMYYGIDYCRWYFHSREYIKSMNDEDTVNKLNLFYDKIIKLINEQ